MFGTFDDAETTPGPFQNDTEVRAGAMTILRRRKMAARLLGENWNFDLADIPNWEMRIFGLMKDGTERELDIIKDPETKCYTIKDGLFTEMVAWRPYLDLDLHNR